MSRVIKIIILLLSIHFGVMAQNTKLDSIRNELYSNPDDTTQVKLLNSLAFDYVFTNPSAGMDDVNIALSKAIETGYIDGEANSLNTKGSLNWALGNYPEALDSYFEAIDLYESVGNYTEIAKCYNNIGEIYKKTDEPEKALEYLNNSLDLLQRYSSTNEFLLIYINIAEVYVEQDSLLKAEDYYLQVMDSDEVPPQYLAYANMGLGRIAEKRDEWKRAGTYFFKGLEIRRNEKDNRGIIDSYVALGNLFKEINNFDSSDYYYKQAIDLSEKLSTKDLLLEAYMGKVVVDSINGNYKSAFRTFLKYSQLKDSTFNNEKSAQMARLQTAYETELLKSENEANRVKVRQQASLITFIVIALILTLILAFALYRQRKLEIRSNKLLREKNEKIKRQSKQLENLNQNLTELNESLEEKIKKRTEKLTEQNEVLSEYAFTNAHELRAPVANILGLINLLQKCEINNKEKELLDHLYQASTQLDAVMQATRKKLEQAEEDLKS